MWVAKNDYDGLLVELAAAREKDIKGEAAKKIKSCLMSIPWGKAATIVKQIVDQPGFPKNLYGAIRSAAEAIKTEDENRKLQNSNWKAVSADSLSGPEFKYLQAINSEIMEWHRLGLQKRNRNGTTAILSIDQWIKLGKPPSWSPILDHFLNESLKSYEQDKKIPGTFLGFLIKYSQMLKDEREKRMEAHTENQK